MISVPGGARPTGLLPFIHPGEPLADRMTFVKVDAAPARRLLVGAGCDLYDIVHHHLDRSATGACAFTLQGGTVADLDLMTGGAGEDGQGIGFRGPHHLSGPFIVEAGSGSTGVRPDGSRFTHCHAAFRTSDGRLIGGHLIPGRTIAGADGIVVDLTAVRQGHFVRRTDPETLFDIFHPEAS